MNEITQKAIDSLNAAVKAHPLAIAAILAPRVPCNETLAAHPFVQVREVDGQFDVAALGLINAVVEPITGDRICAVYADDLYTVVRFQLYVRTAETGQ